MTQRTLKNKQFNNYKTGVKINKKHKVGMAFVENTVWPVKRKQDCSHVCVCVCVCVCLNLSRVC